MPEQRRPSPLQSIVAATWCCAAMSAPVMGAALWSLDIAANLLYSIFLPGVVAAYIVWRTLGPQSTAARRRAIVQGALAGAAMPVAGFISFLIVNVAPRLFRPQAQPNSIWRTALNYANEVLHSNGVLFYLTCCALPAATLAGALFVAYGLRPVTERRTRVQV